MGNHKQVLCKVCNKEMRSHVLIRHTKQHSKINENNAVTNMSVINSVHNTKSIVSTQRSEKENENKDENSLSGYIS